MAGNADKSNIASSLLTSFNRVKQYTTEKITKAEKTEYDREYVQLAAAAEHARTTATQIAKHTETYLQPNPNRRMETAVYSKLQRKPKERMNELESLGQALVDSAERTGSDSTYGSALLQCGKVQIDLGDKWCLLQSDVQGKVLAPLRAFVADDARAAAAEQKRLNRLRLDLDAAKNKQKKANVPEKSVAAREQVDEAQVAFDGQLEATRLVLQNLQRSSNGQVHKLLAFMEAQKRFFAAAAELTTAACAELRNSVGAPPTDPTPAKPPSRPPAPKTAAAASGPAPLVAADLNPGATDAPFLSRVLCDYDAVDPAEMSVRADEMVRVVEAEVPGFDGFVTVEHGGAVGRVPKEYLDLD